jgi:hypothetical protein
VSSILQEKPGTLTSPTVPLKSAACAEGARRVEPAREARVATLIAREPEAKALVNLLLIVSISFLPEWFSEMIIVKPKNVNQLKLGESYT